MYRFILQEDVASYDLSSITHCCTAGEALPSDVFLKWKEITGLEIYEGFGQSETTLVIGNLVGKAEGNIVVFAIAYG